MGLTGSWDGRISRRTLLRTGGSAAIGLVLCGGRPAPAAAGPRFASDPFTLGVASGDPAPDGVVLWTRLAPDPLHGGGLGDASYRVRFELAVDEDFRRIVGRGHVRARPEEAHTVHVEVRGLEPATTYWYRFESRRVVSPVGRTRTAPAPGTLGALRFAFASCQNYSSGYFTAYAEMAREDLDLVVHLGDYIYEGPGAQTGPRLHEPNRTLLSLLDFRTRHAQCRTDPALQAAHAACPWLMTWDDHEFRNNYADLDVDPDEPLETVAERRAAAYLAYWEHSPLSRARKPVGPDMPLYRRISWGDLARFQVLDTRQHRSDQPRNCRAEERGPGGYCPEALDPSRALLGEAQRTWLLAGLAESPARWNVIANQVQFAPYDFDERLDVRSYRGDTWDGYVADRQRVLDFLSERRPANPVVITGDAHVHSVRDVPPDFLHFDAPPVATEFIGTSISTGGDPGEPVVLFDADANNPHRRFHSNQRGYVRVDVTPQAWVAEHRAVSTVRAPEAETTVLATFAVEDGRPGAVRVAPDH